MVHAHQMCCDLRVQLDVTVHRARLGESEYRVLRPAVPIRNVTLRDAGGWYMLWCADPGEIMRVAALWQLAARSRRTLVHVPLRLNHEAQARSGPWSSGRPMDLLLVHHSLQLPASRWKQIRSRLDAGRPLRTDTGVDPHTELTDRVGEPWVAHDSHDVLDLADHSDTVIVTGSSRSLHAGAFPFLQLATWAPSGLRSNPQMGYYSATLHPHDGLLRHRSGRGIYLFYTDQWLDSQTKKHHRTAAGAHEAT